MCHYLEADSKEDWGSDILNIAYAEAKNVTGLTSKQNKNDRGQKKLLLLAEPLSKHS